VEKSVGTVTLVSTRVDKLGSAHVILGHGLEVHRGEQCRLEV
jgi:hypothetical protein